MKSKSKKNPGKLFENQFKKSLEDYGDKIEGYEKRFPDSPMSFNARLQEMTRFTLKNPYDYFAYYYPNFFAFELKSTQGTSFTIAQNNSKKEEKKMIKYHQIEGLREAQKAKGAYGGFVFNFRSNDEYEQDVTYYMNIEDFDKWNSKSTKGSISKKDIILNGGILIKQDLIRVSYSFDIEKMIKDILIWCERNK